MTDQVAPGTEVLLGGRYRLGPALGSGGAAAVHRARDMLLGREVAIKVYRSAATDQAEIDRQEAEIRTIAALNHPSLVTVLDAGVYLPEKDKPTIFLVMELLNGENLHARIQRGRLSSEEAALVGFDIADGLQYLADRAVVHRDIKPGNILLVSYSSGEARRRAKLIDFGIAKSDGQPEMATPGTTTGTAPYLSPEQASGEEVTPASDVYSLGLVILECLTGVRAFPGEAIPSAVARLMRDPDIPKSLPDAWRSLLAEMTARTPEDRPGLRDVVLRLRGIAVAELAEH
ncbi:serine/threonine protein kinase [Salinibacterium sp. SYSU T00001]|uniref:serine/threonine-protein kinase n=1 Tax=Homoserinimonas sedimenticola TaxID=2986805 RepID=UPI002235A20D|nr:serine/threonine-protein kinase [Salinibacterium sedimenticola]MCW4384808.1 serine/threonine protein kinase [Salinibacterium sedimenticola]